MKAIQALSHRRAAHSGPTFSTSADTIDMALSRLSEGGFEFEPVDRCPAPCRFCDGALCRAA